MKARILLLAAAVAASPALAQHEGHNMPGMSRTAAKPAPKKPAPKKPAPKKAAPRKTPTKAAPERAALPPGAAAQASAPADHSEHAGRETVASPIQRHEHEVSPGAAGANHGAHQASEAHAGHAMPAAAPAPGPPPPAALEGPEDAADTVWGTAAMQPSRAPLLTKEHGGMPSAKLLLDQLETRVRTGGDVYYLNGEGWYGGDIDKLWLKAEIEGDYGRGLEQAEIQALWSHAVGPWFNLQTGVRVDAEPVTRGRLVLGVEGLAPYWIEVDAAAFISDKGDLTARIEAEHDLRLARRLVLQPRTEFDFALQDIPRERIGSGLSAAELGLRLRYEAVPNFAPYLGVNYEHAFGDTRRFREAHEDDAGAWSFLVGIRTWF